MSRECDLQEIARLENHSFPAALCQNGKLHICQKSQLDVILETHAIIPDTEPAIIINGSAMINTLTPRSAKTFEDFAAMEVLPTLQLYSAKYKRPDIIVNVYQVSSLKAERRSSGRQGTRRRVVSKANLPPN